jgi:hypothetical protein
MSLGRRRRQCGSIAAMPTIIWLFRFLGKQDSLQNSHKPLDEVTNTVGISPRYIYVNDGSADEP